MRRCGVILQNAVDRSRYTKDCVLQSTAFHHYREAYTRLFHDIRLQLSQNQRYCTNIGKEQKAVVTQTVAFHTVLSTNYIFSEPQILYLIVRYNEAKANIIHLGSITVQQS